ncbi:MAG: quinoprotein dehydrogenase-associated SoxYZ-like carrier [Zoogloeaceae bacterium]|nr:quinoprotein dehydrogenase-associated SoxYZ-like carrier [Zoogloeaceae bacterium]
MIRHATLAALSLALLAGSSAGAANLQTTAGVQTIQSVSDPLDSPRWEDMRKMFFGDAPVIFDERVRVSAPRIAEDSMNVPVTVDASALGDARSVLVFADFNPIIKVLEFQATHARPSLGFRLKLQQSSPVRAAVLGSDGIWRVGGAWITATGGGCTLPSTGSSSPEWQERLNEVNGRIWSRVDGGERVRMRIIHPMDTGLAAGIPVFHIEDLALADSAGRKLIEIQTFEPVSENPSFTIDLPPEATSGGRLHVSGRDNNGNRIDAWVTP